MHNNGEDWEDWLAGYKAKSNKSSKNVVYAQLSLGGGERRKQTRFENCVRIAKSPSSLCPRKSRPARETEKEREGARKSTEGAGTKLVHCVVDHDDHFVDIMRQLAEPQPQPQPQP